MTQTTRQSLIPQDLQAPNPRSIDAQRRQQQLIINALRRKLLGLKAFVQTRQAGAATKAAEASPSADTAFSRAN